MDGITFVILLITYVAQWFVYKKMGREGWEGIIPLYNTYVMFEELYGSGWSFLKILIPFYGIYVVIKCNIDLAHNFNKSTGFGWGLTLLPTIFMCITGFSKDIVWRDGSINVDPMGDVFGSNNNTVSDADTLIKYKELLDNGVISEEEFAKIKERILKI